MYALQILGFMYILL